MDHEFSQFTSLLKRRQSDSLIEIPVDDMNMDKEQRQTDKTRNKSFEERLLMARNTQHLQTILTTATERCSFEINQVFFIDFIRNLELQKDPEEYNNMLNLILKHITKENRVQFLNARDKDTKLIPLEYVALQKAGCKQSSRFDDTIKTMLDMGASLAEKSGWGVPVIYYLDYDWIKKYLDGCVIKKNGRVSYDYKNMLPWIPKDCNDYVDVLHLPLYIKSSNIFKDLMSHDLIIMFLSKVCHYKWNNHRKFFYANLFMFLLFYISLCLQVVTCYTPIKNTQIFLLFTTCLLISRELFQFVIARKLYIRTIENYLEILIISLSVTACCCQDKFVRDQIVVFAFLFSTFDFVFQIGKYPTLIRYMLVFKTTLKIFAKLSSFIFLIIFAFAICFDILFKSKDSIQSPLEDIAKSIFNTIIMISGQFDSNYINFKHYPISSHLILLFFFTIVTIVLMNVVLGLAISDIQNLERNSKLHGFIANIEFFHQIEVLLFEKKLNLTFSRVGKFHKFLDLPRKIIEDNSNLWQSLILPSLSRFDESERMDVEDVVLVLMKKLSDDVGFIKKCVEGRQIDRKFRFMSQNI